MKRHKSRKMCRSCGLGGSGGLESEVILVITTAKRQQMKL
jgi:hypothetical protein